LREADFVDDDSHGNETIYYANGKVKEATVYNFDEKDGAYRLYYENGKIYKEGQYLLGNEHGEWKIYSVDGKLSEILMYNNGILYEIRKP
jgi:antitoxin component YwqK of YwqJK toxin-antitoxin module